MGSLDDKLNDVFVQLSTSEEQKAKINSYLQLVKAADRATYRHSVRVGLLGFMVGNLMGFDRRALFYSGVLHDIGKIMLPPSTMGKRNIGKKDMELIASHPYDSYDFLSREFAFSADIVVRHHSHQKEAYPKVLPPYSRSFSENTKKKIESLSKVLAIIDFYDSAKNRKNQKFSRKSRMLSPDKVKELLVSEYPSMKELIGLLYETKVFT
jgi:response regulator RpfG family c-di-GMP phosphodiesterase